MARQETAWLGWRAAVLAAVCCFAACRTSKAKAPGSAASAPRRSAPTAEVAIPPAPSAATSDVDADAGADADASVDADAGTPDAIAADAGSGLAPAREPHPKTNIEIDLERTVCFGTCPIYTLKLYGDGTVVFNGKDYVARGLHVAHIPASQVRDLARWLKRAGFFALSWNKHCGKGQATDNPSAITTLRMGSHKRTINHYHGDLCAPGVLDAWEQRVDKVAGTNRWLGMP